MKTSALPKSLKRVRTEFNSKEANRGILSTVWIKPHRGRAVWLLSKIFTVHLEATGQD